MFICVFTVTGQHRKQKNEQRRHRKKIKVNLQIKFNTGNNSILSVTNSEINAINEYFSPINSNFGQNPAVLII